jgi:hypothetical protein
MPLKRTVRCATDASVTTELSFRNASADFVDGQRVLGKTAGIHPGTGATVTEVEPCICLTPIPPQDRNTNIPTLFFAVLPGKFVVFLPPRRGELFAVNALQARLF